jgi:hypothetical protein
MGLMERGIGQPVPLSQLIEEQEWSLMPLKKIS